MIPSPLVYLFAFLAICFVSSLVMNMIRLRDPRAILLETTHLFLTVAVGILVFSAVVWVLEWILIRPLV